MEFKDKLRTLRTERGLSQQELADAIYVSRSAVAKWENGLGLPGRASMEALTAYFAVTPDALDTEQPELVIVEKNRKLRRQGSVLSALGSLLSTLLVALLMTLITSANYGFTSEMAAYTYADCSRISTPDYDFYYTTDFEGEAWECINSFRPVKKNFYGFTVSASDYEYRPVYLDCTYVGCLSSMEGTNCWYHILDKNVNTFPAFLLPVEAVQVGVHVCPVTLNS